MIDEKDLCLRVKDLSTNFYTDRGVLRAVRGISFVVLEGEMLGIVGESGCGKSVTAFSILNQVKHPGRIDGGEVFFHGIDLLKLPPDEMRRLRGSNMSMIFQEPLTALNPSFTIGWQIAETIRIQGEKNKKVIREKVIDILNKVMLPEPELRMKEYPYQLSGGMRQRALIAIALACKPDLVFADEPTTALDVTVQSEILDLIQNLQEDFGMSIVLISHNLNLIGERCSRVLVFYAGKIVEEATTEELFREPSHPYTMGLMGSLLSVGQNSNFELTNIPGDVPNLIEDIRGCSFAPRCSFAFSRCFEIEPQSIEIAPQHFCSCHLYSKEGKCR
ncbi:MAG: ABC transporter ATP-binding protein [Fastidiosipila sp.]|nr:ABC transporter ATP-binding protein [Fastidiosipila sp.]